MKLKYIFTTLVAACAMLCSCSDDDGISTLDSVKVSSSFVALPAEGGQVTIDVEAKGSWNITASASSDSETAIPDWLTISPASGSAGKQTITFSAPAATSSNSTTLYLNCNGEQQRINVLQQTEAQEVPLSTCAEVNAGNDGTTYRVKGTVTNIANTTYGNLYINDGTGEVYVYGTLDASGNEKNFSSLGIEVGDEVTVEGPRKTYSGTIELVNVTVINISKSLIKVDSLSVETLPKEGGEFIAYLTTKGNGVSVDAPDWLSVKGIKTSGTNAEVTFKAAANDGGLRTAALEFTTASGEKTYTATTNISQEGSIVDATIAEFNAAEVGSTQYRLSGVVTSVKNTKYGNFYIKDATGETYVYGLDNFSSLGIEEGDIVTVVGQRGAYKETIEVLNATLEDKKDVETVTIADFLSKEDNSSVYYKISGTVSNIKSTTYGNYNLTDETGTVYIYGTLAGWNGASKQFESLGIAEGDKVTLITVKTSYNGTAQGKNAIFVSKD